jgi:hypothetical protein
MKTKNLLFIVILISFFSLETIPQSFYTGNIGVALSNFGRVRVYSDNLVTWQIDRSSLLVGVSPTAVFDYTQDAGTVTPASTVSSPLLSDFEVTGTIDNSDSNLPPEITAIINLYGWTNGAYLLVKMNVKNDDVSSINTVIGGEIIPNVDDTYENDFIQYNAATQTVLMNETTWVGWKLFSPTTTSFNVIDWVSGYANDASFYSWLTQNSFDPPLTSTVEGVVAVQGSAPINLGPGESTDFYFGISLGTDQTSCLNNMAACEVKYNQIVPVELTSFTANADGNSVQLNWSTASELNNAGFEIQRKSPADKDWIVIGFEEGKGTVTETQSYSYLDNVTHLQMGIVSYRLKQIDFGGTFSFNDIVNVEINPSPDQFELMQNYPNPFNPSTAIKFGIPEASNVRLKIFNSLGEEVVELVNEYMEAGTYTYSFDASNLPSGIYVYTLQSGEQLISKKMTLIK